MNPYGLPEIGQWWVFGLTIRVVVNVIEKPGCKTRVRWRWPGVLFVDRIYECTIKTWDDQVKLTRAQPVEMRFDILGPRG